MYIKNQKCDPDSRDLVLSLVELLCNSRKIPVLVPFYRITPEPHLPFGYLRFNEDFPLALGI